jgi:hypothetical protein
MALSKRSSVEHTQYVKLLICLSGITDQDSKEPSVLQVSECDFGVFDRIQWTTNRNDAIVPTQETQM